MKKKYKTILLTGGSGNLGKAIQNSRLFPPLFAPNHREMDIADSNAVEKYFDQHEIDAVIHCAALARIAKCEDEPRKALEANIMGTSNLVKAVLRKTESKKDIRFVHISTDGVYPGIDGNYKEGDVTIPYNRYGWTKLGAECAVNLLSNFCIIRTNFFDPKGIKFDTSAKDIFTSKIPVEELAKAIAVLLESDFVGTVNVGDKRESDFQRYKQFKLNLKSCQRKDILKEIRFKIYADELGVPGF